MKIKKSKRSPPWGGIFNKERFKWMEEEEIKELQKMSIEESISLMEGLLDSGFVEECRRIQKKLDINRCRRK